jgi:hypothetical protein
MKTIKATLGVKMRSNTASMVMRLLWDGYEMLMRWLWDAYSTNVNVSVEREYG